MQSSKWVHETVWSEVKVIQWITFIQGHWDSTFSNFFSLETAGPIEAKLHVEPSWDEGLKVSTTASRHMAKMGTVPIYDKNL